MTMLIYGSAALPVIACLLLRTRRRKARRLHVHPVLRYRLPFRQIELRELGLGPCVINLTPAGPLCRASIRTAEVSAALRQRCRAEPHNGRDCKRTDLGIKFAGIF